MEKDDKKALLIDDKMIKLAFKFSFRLETSRKRGMYGRRRQLRFVILIIKNETTLIGERYLKISVTITAYG